LNSFKQVNDEYGHAGGDDLLRKFSDELKKKVSAEDTVGRWGGDEFIILLNRDSAGAEAQIGRIRDWVFGKYDIQTNSGSGKITVTVSAAIGLAQWLPGKTVQQILEEADASMYLDKKNLLLEKKMTLTRSQVKGCERYWGVAAHFEPGAAAGILKLN